MTSKYDFDLIDLAAAIEKLPHAATIYDRTGFNMRRHTHPNGAPSDIAGWAVYTFPSYEHGMLMTTPTAIFKEAQSILGLSDSNAKLMFVPPAKIVPNLSDITPRQAATCIRNYVMFGVVDWEQALTGELT